MKEKLDFQLIWITMQRLLVKCPGGVFQSGGAVVCTVDINAGDLSAQESYMPRYLLGKEVGTNKLIQGILPKGPYSCHA